MNLQDKEAFRKCREMSEFYAAKVAEQKKNLVPEDICESFVSGWQAALEYLRKGFKQCGCGDVVGRCACLDREIEGERERSKKLVEALEKMADFNVIMDRRAAASEVLEKIKR